MEVALAEINPILNAFKIVAAVTDKTDHGSPKIIGQNILFSVLSSSIISNVRFNVVWTSESASKAVYFYIKQISCLFTNRRINNS